MRITPVKGGVSVVDLPLNMLTRIIPVLSVALCVCAPVPVLSAQDAARPRPVVAVVLSGGGALGFAHVGALKVIEEIGIPVDIVVGTSMGAIVGGLYAAGYSPSDMEKLSRGVDWQSAFDDALADSPYSFREREVSRRYPFSLDLNAGGPSTYRMEPPGYQLHAWLDGRLVTHTGVFGDYAGPYPFHGPGGALLDGVAA